MNTIDIPSADISGDRVLGFQIGVTIPDEALDLIAGSGGKAGCVLTDHGNDAFCTNPGNGGQ